MDGVLRSYTVCDDCFPQGYQQLQADAEFHLAVNKDGYNLPYLIEVGVGRSTVFMWKNKDHVPEPMIQEALWFFTLHVFSGQKEKQAYLVEKRLQDAMRKSKIKIQK